MSPMCTDLSFHALTINGQGRPRISAVDLFIDVEESGLFKRRNRERN